MSKFYVRSKKIVQICDRIVLFWIRLYTSQCNEPNIFFQPPPLPSSPYLLIWPNFLYGESMRCLRSVIPKIA